MTAEDHIAAMVAKATAPVTYEFSLEEEAFDFDPALLELSPVAGDPIIGKLTDTEAKLYRICCSVESVMDEIAEVINREVRADIADALLDSENPSFSAAINKAVVDYNQMDKVEELLRHHSLWQKMLCVFWHMVRTRLQTFTTLLAIRSEYTVCRIGSKLHG